MKKSTLITTIAMIVVVVVALSTATYAWFSTAANSVATTQITTTASVDWLMVKGTYNSEPAYATATPGSGATATFNTAAADTITLSNGMAAGLYSPAAAITTSLSSAAETVISNLAIFYNAKQTVANGVTTVKEDTLFDGVGNGDALTEGHQNHKLPDVIKVSNGQRASKNLRLSIIVNAGGTQDSTATIYAAAATSFYVAWQGAGTNALTGNVTNGYNWKTNVNPGADFVNDLPAEGDKTHTSTTEVSKSTTPKALSGTKPAYNGQTNVTGWTVDGAADTTLGIAAGDDYILYSVDIGAVGVGESVYILIYTWIDGWIAEANAAGANYTVTYAFTSYN